MLEKKQQRLLPKKQFYHRLLRSFLVGMALVAFSLTIGICGYHFVAGLSWIDAFVDASMILSGMGPLSQLHSNGAKLFAGCYAIYCGLSLITIAAVILTPVVHRGLHKFHLEDEKSS